MNNLITETHTNISMPQKNWQVWLGAILVFVIIVTSFLGPTLAPRDPLQENFVVFLNDETFVKPPFAAFIVPGFPLGSDDFGRDILSRLLWGIKPTLILALVAASLRLIIGAIIGIFSGWTNKKKTTILNMLISLTGTFPVLFIALCVIAATGQKMGIWAFILGLTITGWGDVARLVREQTRVIKSQLYIEASQALGASSAQMLGAHVLPQIMPSVWMMLAFEVSGSLLITAELGVLGYFINAVWIPIGDWVGLRTSGLPELSQMLGDLQKQPWGALGAGLLVFITILGFNLLGEGLRLWTSPEIQRRQKSILGLQISEWVDDRIFSPQASLRRMAPIFFGIAFLVAIVIGGGVYLWQTQSQEMAQNIPPLPGGHQWVTTFRDSQGTLWSPFESPKDPVITWINHLGDSLSGGPVIDSTGIIYITSMDSRLHAVSPTGDSLWSVNLPNPPVGYPALTGSGLVYIADIKGGITLVRPDLSVIEVVKGISTKSPAITGPLVASDNSVYYATTDYFYALTPDAKLKWKEPLPTYSMTSPIIRLTRDDQYLLFEDFIIRAENGELAVKNTPDPLDRLILGANGRIYRLTQTYIEEVKPEVTENNIPRQIKWDSRALGTSFRYPRNSGVTPDGKIWLHFGGINEFNRIVWLDANGVNLNIFDYPYRGGLSILAAIDKNNTVILCGSNINLPVDQPGNDCRANTIGSSSSIWTLPVDGNPVGGALIKDRLYIATGSGNLYAIESK